MSSASTSVQRWWLEGSPEHDGLVLVEEFGAGPGQPSPTPWPPRDFSGWLNGGRVGLDTPHADAVGWVERIATTRESEAAARRRKARFGTLFELGGT